MYGYKNVNESYYQHQCSATTEEDVIYQDISGKGVLPRLKRWWHDLFLLSYSDSRSKHYYMSSYSMMTARTGHFRNNRGYIHPFSKFRNFWDCLILLLLVVRIVLFHFNASILHSTPLILHYIVAGIEYVIILDLFISTRTGYAIKKTRKVVMKSSDIFRNYLSTRACIEVVCAIPLQNLKFLRHGNVSDPEINANLFMPTLKLICMFQTIRLFVVSEYWARDRDTFWATMSFKLLRIVVLGIVAIIQIESLNTAWSVINFITRDGYEEPDSYLETMLVYKYVHMERSEALYLFVMISRLFKSLLLFGYCLRPNKDIIDQMCAILTYFTAFIFHFWASVVVYHCVVRENSLDDTLSTTWDQTLSILRHRRLDDKVYDKVKTYYNFKLSHALVIQRRNRLFKALPRELQWEIKMSCYSKLVEEIPCFAEWPAEMIASVVELFYQEIYLEDDVLSSPWGRQEGLVIVEAGMIAVYSGQQEVRHLVDGDHFGEHTIATDDPVPSAVLIAITPTGIQVVDKSSFRDMMKRFPHKYTVELEERARD